MSAEDHLTLSPWEKFRQFRRFPSKLVRPRSSISPFGLLHLAWVVPSAWKLGTRSCSCRAVCTPPAQVLHLVLVALIMAQTYFYARHVIPYFLETEMVCLPPTLPLQPPSCHTRHPLPSTLISMHDTFCQSERTLAPAARAHIERCSQHLR